MAIPIEGYSVVVQAVRIAPLLADDAVEIPNNTVLADDHLWRCSFMAETDARRFLRSLGYLGLNVSRGPDSDAVLVLEMDRSVEPYCEWLQTGQWEKAVIGWMVGTEPKSVVAREGWDPKVGSGIVYCDRESMDHLEFLRLEGNIEVYFNKETQTEVYIGRTSVPVEALFKTATETIGKHFVTTGEDPVDAAAAKEVAEALEMLEKVIDEAPDLWNAFWYQGKGHLALGNHEQAYRSFRRAYDIEKDYEGVPRELAGVCLELGNFEEAVAVAEEAAALEPDTMG